MNLALILSTLGILLITFSLALLPPIFISLLYHDGELWHLSFSLALTFLVGSALYFSFKKTQQQLRHRDGFIIVAMFWLVLGLTAGIPFLFGHHLDFSDAVFEAISAMTTTGATVIVGLDDMPKSILFYRQELQWLGGIGVIVSAVAILPMLGIGGMQLYLAETPGPVKDDKLRPRITSTAQTLWIVYGAITVACAFFYWLAGMSVFDAVAHSFSTVSTGGFSTHDASMKYFNSPTIEAISGIFMMLGAMNFSMHYSVWYHRDLRVYWRNSEVRNFIKIVGLLILITTLTLYFSHKYTHIETAFRYAYFEVISIITSTGFGTDDFSVWPGALPMLLMLSSIIGGCAGSTAGGIKVVRVILLIKQGLSEIGRLIHPAQVTYIKLDKQLVSERVKSAVWGFFAFYVLIFALFVLLLMADGMDMVTAFGAVATCINNMGPGLGEVSSNFVGVSNEAEWLLSLAMLLGRLELFTMLVLISPAYWRD